MTTGRETDRIGAEGEKMPYFVYMLRCADGTLYTGSAADIDRRAAAHNAGRGAKYTRGRLPAAVVYRESCADRSVALRREAAIKRLTRQQKLRLIEQSGRTKAGNDGEGG